MGKGFDKIAAGFRVALVAAGNPLRSPGEDDSGHTGVARLAEWRLVGAESCFPPQRVILTEHRASTAVPGGSEAPSSGNIW